MLRFDIVAAQTVTADREKVVLKGASSAEVEEKDGVFEVRIYFDLKEQDRSFGLVKISKQYPRRFYLSFLNDVEFTFYGKAVELGRNWAKLEIVRCGLDDAESEWGRVKIKKVGGSASKKRPSKNIEDF